MASKQRKATHMNPNSLTNVGAIITAVFDSGTRQLTVSGLTSNTLYYLYLRSVSNVPTLFAVTTVPSTYRVSFPDAMLVGAFYSNGTTSIGSFVTIEGCPRTQNPWAPTGTTGNWVTNVTYNALIERDGKMMRFNHISACTGSPSGTFAPAIPGGGLYTIDNTIINNVNPILGVVKASIGANTFTGVALFSSINDMIAVGPNQGTWTATVPGTFVNGSVAAVQGEIPITSWSATPLKDL